MILNDFSNTVILAIRYHLHIHHCCRGSLKKHRFTFCRSCIKEVYDYSCTIVLVEYLPNGYKTFEYTIFSKSLYLL